MGLTARGYEFATPIDEHEFTEDCHENDHKPAYVIDPKFEKSLRGLDDMFCYLGHGRSASVSNSYGGHSRFREELSRAVLEVEPSEVWHNLEEYEDAPFFELINFADNEGTIGPEAAADLRDDFIENREVFGEFCEWDEFWLETYDEWTEVMTVAANTGMVVFS